MSSDDLLKKLNLGMMFQQNFIQQPLLELLLKGEAHVDRVSVLVEPQFRGEKMGFEYLTNIPLEQAKREYLRKLQDVGFGMQLWMYATPVAYSMKMFVGTPLYRIVNYNPMTPVINAMRYACLGPDCGRFDLKYYLVSVVMTVVILLIGMLMYNKAEKNFTDTV